MLQQISESELVLMKIIWKNGGSALYSHIMDELEKDNNEWKKNTVLTLLSRLIEKKYLKAKKLVGATSMWHWCRNRIPNCSNS